MDPTRRIFLKTVAGGAGALAVGAGVKVDAAPAATAAKPALTTDHELVQIGKNGLIPCTEHSHHAAREGVPGRKWIMVIDLARCDGCGKCIEACSKMHAVPPKRQWIKVLRMQDTHETSPYWMPKPCFHCDNPPCTRVCPVDATYKRSDGVVLIDNERCIGCRFCMAACPYSTRVFNWGPPADPPEAKTGHYSPECGIPRRVGTVEKCDFCPNLAAQGILPSCSSICAMGAIYFGDQNEDAVTNGKGETERLSSLLRERAGYRFMEELGTKPRVYYLAAKNRMYPAPGEENPPTEGEQ